MNNKAKQILRGLSPFHSSGIFLLDAVYFAVFFFAVGTVISFIIYL